MLRPERPPHVTILCLVRDAAARFYKAKGTRADICALIRFSQYFVRDTSDAQLQQVVSGAMDRLHYERDPCIKYDNDTRLWTYLHRDRKDDEYDGDGMQSMRKWGPKKLGAEEVEEEEGEGERGEEEGLESVKDTPLSDAAQETAEGEDHTNNNRYGFDTAREDESGKGLEASEMRRDWGSLGGGEMGSLDNMQGFPEHMEGLSTRLFGEGAEAGVPPPVSASEADWQHQPHGSNGGLSERQVSANSPLGGYGGEWGRLGRMQYERGAAGSAEYRGRGGYNDLGTSEPSLRLGRAGEGDGPHLTLGGKTGGNHV